MSVLKLWQTVEKWANKNPLRISGLEIELYASLSERIKGEHVAFGVEDGGIMARFAH